MIIKVLDPKTKRSGKRVLCKCDNCNKEFVSKLSEQTRRNKKHHFCCKNCFLDGRIISEKSRIISRQNIQKLLYLKRELNPHWKNGITKNQKGYLQILMPNHPNNINGYILLHRYIMEQSLKRYLIKEEVVHHIDGNKNNNDVENLMLFKNGGEHTRYHSKLRKMGMASIELVDV
jgi:hypothetical protein